MRCAGIGGYLLDDHHAVGVGHSQAVLDLLPGLALPVLGQAPAVQPSLQRPQCLQHSGIIVSKMPVLNVSQQVNPYLQHSRLYLTDCLLELCLDTNAAWIRVIGYTSCQGFDQYAPSDFGRSPEKVRTGMARQSLFEVTPSGRTPGRCGRWPWPLPRSSSESSAPPSLPETSQMRIWGSAQTPHLSTFLVMINIAVQPDLLHATQVVEHVNHPILTCRHSPFIGYQYAEATNYFEVVVEDD